MRAAPAVAVHGSGGGWARLAVAGLPALAGASFAAWLAAHGGWPVVYTAAAAFAAGAVVLAWRLRVWAAQPAAHLVWDGQVWAVDDEPGHLQLMLDLGSLLVLRLQPAAGPRRWLAVSAAEAGADWRALRCAVYSRPPRTTPAVLAPERSPD